MTAPTDVLVGDHRPTGCAPGLASVPEAGPCTAADLDAMDIVQELQVQEIAYRATLQALDGPLVADLRRFLG